MTVETFLGRKVAEYDPPVRGDAITGDRYYSKDWAQQEWDRVWTRVWHIGGVAADLVRTGDYLTHNLVREPVVMMKQQDGSVRAFFNACKHRGYRLAWNEVGGGDALTCGYHGWKWAPDGTLIEVQDPEDFAAGNPCGKTRLEEVRCEVEFGFVWYNMDPNARPLRDWLGVVADQLDAWQMDKMTRVMAVTSDVPCNWKIIRDNFNESYHIPTLHPQIASSIDDDYTDTVFEMFPNEHNRMVMKGLQPSGRYSTCDIVELPLSEALAFWDLDPAAFEGNAKAVRKAVQAQKRKLFREKGYPHYATLSDSQLTDYHHYTLFPNVTLTMWPDGAQLLRSEPHPTDPERCVFDHWFMARPEIGSDTVVGPSGPTKFEAVDRTFIPYGSASLGEVADQDLSVAVGQQEGLHSRGYTGGLLPLQEKRVQRFHEILNDYVEGRR